MPRKKIYANATERQRAYRQRRRERDGKNAWTNAELRAEIARLERLLSDHHEAGNIRKLNDALLGDYCPICKPPAAL